MFPRHAVSRATCAVAFGLLAAVFAAPRETSAAPPHRTRELNAFDAAAIDRAKEGAVRKLQAAECQKVLAEFKDREGRPLQEKLDRLGLGPAEYLQMIPFLDGGSQQVCRWSKVDLATVPGVPRVFVCGQFAGTQLRDPWLAETIVIHEMLHTLGLGENPPTSNEITQRVKGRCQ